MRSIRTWKSGIVSRWRRSVPQRETPETGKREICPRCGAPIPSSRMSLREEDSRETRFKASRVAVEPIEICTWHTTAMPQRGAIGGPVAIQSNSISEWSNPADRSALRRASHLPRAFLSVGQRSDSMSSHMVCLSISLQAAWLCFTTKPGRHASSDFFDTQLIVFPAETMEGRGHRIWRVVPGGRFWVP